MAGITVSATRSTWASWFGLIGRPQSALSDAPVDGQPASFDLPDEIPSGEDAGRGLCGAHFLEKWRTNDEICRLSRAGSCWSRSP